MLKRKNRQVAKKKAKHKTIFNRVMKIINFVCSIGVICSFVKMFLN